MTRTLSVVLLVGLGTLTGAARLDAADPAKLEYNRDIRPILAENCFACHGPDSAARKAKLRLDQRDAAVEAGAIAPGKPDDSEMIARILLPSADDGVMPPVASHKSLKPAQKETLKKWVAQGAEYQAHWAFIPPTRPRVPQIRNPQSAIRNPIDAFALAELQKRGLSMAPEADRRTLARRLSLDLLGLPPSPAEVEAFVADTSADYYERYVDKLMASVHWGEHRGRHWLDAARYADTHGIHFDNYREMWAYRDWVIHAINKNMRFDQFTTEQLAGDLLPNPTLDQKVATGFNRCNITTNEGGAINEEYLVLYTRDRTEAVSQTWMGLTAGCAVCHDHKFDPLSQREFYGMAAFFNNINQNAMDGNIKDTPPIVFVPATADRAGWDSLQVKLAAANAKLAARRSAARKDFEAWLTAATPDAAAAPDDGLKLAAWLDEGAGTTVRYVADGKPRVAVLPADVTDWRAGPLGNKVVGVKAKANGPTLAFPKDVADLDADKPFSYGAWVQIPQRGQTGGILARMDDAKASRGWDLWLENDKFAAHLVHKWPDDGIKVRTKNGFDPNKWHHVFVTYDGSRSPAGLKLYVDGDVQPVDIMAQNKQVAPTDKITVPAGSIKADVPLTVGRRTPGQPLRAVGVQDLRVYAKQLSGTEVARLAASGKVAAVLSKPADKRTAAEVDDVFGWWLGAEDKPSRELTTSLQNLRAAEAEFKARGTMTHVSAEKSTPAEAYVLNRGEYDQRREKVAPGTPKALPAFGPGLPPNRLGFARWLLHKDHPLTARVTVNRFWQEVFGTGLVRTSGDFGVTGELPSHPELLDWLAEEFETDWDVKRFFKLVVTSATYRQSAAVTPEKLEKDRDNRWLSRGPRFRMDAEVIRDYALAASGLLVPKIGGPSVRPYQPEGVWEAVAMIGSNTRDYRPDRGDSLYRRSMYTFWKRAAPPASMEVLNAPNRETCTVRRERTNTPLQALLTLNDVQFVEAARVLAEAAVAGAKTDAARIDFVSARLLARPFTAAEKAIVTASLGELRAAFKAQPDEAKKLVAFGERKPAAGLDAVEVAAWAMLCNQLLNLDEVLNK